jgi:hypothetical protein
MRKSLWIIAVLFVAMGAPIAHAQTTLLCGGTTVCASGGYVTEIEDLTIGSTSYNVTFGTTDSSPSTFSTYISAEAAAAGIATALDDSGADYGIVSSATFCNAAGCGQGFGVAAGGTPDNAYYSNFYLREFEWSGPTDNNDTQLGSQCLGNQAPCYYDGGEGYFAEFSPTPLPSHPNRAQPSSGSQGSG